MVRSLQEVYQGMKYRIKGWLNYQHYKDRCPPWIKLHHALLTSEVWVMGTDATRTLAIASMLLAARNEANDGTFNGDPEYIKRFAYLNTAPCFKQLIEYDFIEVLQDASDVLAECNTEQSRAEQRREEKEKRQSKEEKALVASDAGRPDCPHQEIINLYHEHLPELAAIKSWTEKRKKNLQSRWREDEKRQSLDYWKRFFVYVSQSDFLMGRKTEWRADLEWLVNSSNFVKVIESKYENRESE
jgi:hypothetical protein